VTLRALLVEDHGLVRAGLRLLLAEIGDVAVEGEAGTVPEALRLITQLRPDIVLLDIALGQMNGLEVAAYIRDKQFDTRVIVLSMHASAVYVRQALQSGAAGYLLKDSAPVELALAINAVMRGETYLSPLVAKRVVNAYIEQVSGAERPIDQLTPRQREILTLIADGQTIQEIAYQLHISVKTAEGHRSQLMERVQIHDIPGLVRLAIREGLIAP
jgi:DNA-binding NarL/FixJ family response regulator